MELLKAFFSWYNTLKKHELEVLSWKKRQKKKLTVKELLKALLVVLLILVIIGSFFEEYDVSGKTIVPFCTNQGSGVNSGYELLKDECDGATVAEGFNGNNTDLNEVTNWLKSQGYIND